MCAVHWLLQITFRLLVFVIIPNDRMHFILGVYLRLSLGHFIHPILDKATSESL